MAEHLPQNGSECRHTPSEDISYFQPFAALAGPPPSPPTQWDLDFGQAVGGFLDSEIRVTNETGTQQPNSRGSRTRQACDHCAKSKRRCDGLNPCGECTKRQKTCSYARLQNPSSRTTLSSPSAGTSTSVGLNSMNDHVDVPAGDLYRTPVVHSMQDNEDLKEQLTTVGEQLNACQHLLTKIYRQLQLLSRPARDYETHEREQEEDKDSGQDAATSPTPNRPARSWRGLPKLMSRKASSKKPRNSIFSSWGKSYRGADGEAS
ncbi:hypothetical protein BC938DRAFT_479781 [Jimgerdemannia flammicorona]|uniref:Zn(2)-C6 fungal-type domain-containing protein n=1 Tax=Jimgerdemannia flammicorona TaxID=994334 RepID=A0A433QK46_9FUNG|nr:hypothetical protein BC938DRAFT_479781 [Jimgerdemannia flammicorona]